MRNMIFSANIGKALCLATMGISLLSTVQVAVAIPAVAAETQVVNRQGGITVFPNREAQYRIPAIVECKSGKLIAFTDHRYHNQDIGGGRHLDIVMKTSMDKGATWSSPEQMVAKGGNGYYSDDEGKTWYGEEVTKQIYDLMPEVESAFFTSGRICQSKQIKVGKYYRVYTVLCTRSGNRILYSDDFGQTWNVLGKNVAEAAPRGDEAKVEELPDGNVLLSSRTMGGRYINIYTYEDKKTATGSWGKVISSDAKNMGVAAHKNSCNGEVLMVDAKKNGKKVKLLLQSVPVGPARNNVGIYYKALETPADYATPEAIAKNWEGCYQLSNTTSAYSTMVQGKNGSIYFLLEENAFKNPKTQTDDYYDIRFYNLSIEQITNNRYK